MLKPKITGLKQLFAKKYDPIQNVPAIFKDSLGDIESAFTMIVYGRSGQGKSNFVMQFLKVLMSHDKVLYVALEERTGATMQKLARRHLNEEEHSGKIKWAETDMKYDVLVKQLAKKNQPQFIVIDSIQYWRIKYEQYTDLKELFPKKAFIFISHATGKKPRGKCAEDIEYDADIKVFVHGGVAFPISRFEGNKPFVIYEEKARKFYGDQYNSVVKGIPHKKAPRKKTVKKAKADAE